MISLPFLYLGRYSKFHFQSSDSETDTACFSIPSALRRIIMLSGRLPASLLLSSQIFEPSIVMVSGVCVLVNTYPFSESPSDETEYVFSPSVPVIILVLSSATVYSISSPLLWTSRSLKDPLHLFASDNTTDFTVSLPFANSLIVTELGRIPSLLSESSQILDTLICVFPGV